MWHQDAVIIDNFIMLFLIERGAAGWENSVIPPDKESPCRGWIGFTHTCNITGTAAELWRIYACYVDAVLGHWPVICMVGGSPTATATLPNIFNTSPWEQLPWKLTALCHLHLFHTSNAAVMFFMLSTLALWGKERLDLVQRMLYLYAFRGIKQITTSLWPLML